MLLVKMSTYSILFGSKVDDNDFTLYSNNLLVKVWKTLEFIRQWESLLKVWDPGTQCFQRLNSIHLNWSCTHRDTVSTFLSGSVEQEVPIRRTFDVDAVCRRFLRNSEYFIMVIGQLFHHLQAHAHFIKCTNPHAWLSTRSNSRAVPVQLLQSLNSTNSQRQSQCWIHTHTYPECFLGPIAAVDDDDVWTSHRADVLQSSSSTHGDGGHSKVLNTRRLKGLNQVETPCLVFYVTWELRL